MFKPVSSKPNFVELEHRILDFWRKNNTLGKYLHKNDSAQKKFSFLDGPITANNPMGVHHAWGRTLKDLYQRYKNMRGFKQRFQNGFDNQGLWVEVEVEKELGFKSKKDIEKYGIARFVEKCKEHTLRFSKVQTEQSKRLGYFMDWGNDYYTMSDNNNYAIWQFLKKVWEDGNLYKGRDSVPWCPRCGTAISQHEILTEEYQELTHDSVYIKFPVKGEDRLYLLAWTTTPWTIPGNVALAVDPELSYWKMVNKKGEKIVIANPAAVGRVRGTNKGTIKALEKEAVTVRQLDLVDDWRKEKELRGAELVGLEYEAPYANLPAVKKALGDYRPRVVAADPLVLEIDPSEGTGIVHVAPGAGTEDFRLGLKEELPAIEEIDESGVFLSGFGFLDGLSVKDASVRVLADLEDRRFAYKIVPYTHRYPVCWRCQTELVWRVVDEWYIAMDDERCPNAKNYRQRLQEVIKKVRWIPSFGYDRELDWLRNMEDWLISKKRYWGLALPIWECSCGHFEVIGSKEELKEKAVEGWEEFEDHTPHRPWVDRVKIKCPRCGELMSRIPDVGNPWLDAGIVPFSTMKYFSDRDFWKEWFPADLVLEALPGQFKNWFYSLLAMSTVLEDQAPFKTLFGHALVKDEYGDEMHKSKGNAIEFGEAAEKMGVDAMRWQYATQDPTRDLCFGYGPADEVRRRFFLIFWNCYKFFVTYAELDGFNPSRDLERTEQTILDSWILSRLNRLVGEATSNLDDYKNSQAARAIEDFVVGNLSTWYIRRIRNRVGPTVPDGEDKKAAHVTLYNVLLTLAKLLAPFTPFLAEEMYQNLSTKEPSVHLTSWPEFAENLIDSKLEEKMKLVRQICERGRAARREAGIRVRQPLACASIKYQVSSIKRSKELQQLIMDELNVKELRFAEGKELSVELDLEITPELKLEGLAREMVRQIQDARRKAGCNLDDRIVATFPDNEGNREAVERFEEYIKKGTLSEELRAGKGIWVEVVKRN